MASKGGVGIDIDVSRVPLREPGMEPFEIMVSESQERMLCVVEPARVDEVIAITDSWEVHGTAIGEVTDTRRDARLRRRARWSARCPSRRSSTTARSTTSSRRSRAAGLRAASPLRRRDATPRLGRCSSCSRAPNIASRRPLFEQYDSIVQSRTVRRSTRRRARRSSPDATPHLALLELLASPNIASRRPLFEQYDSIVQSRTARRPSSRTPPC